MRAWDGSYWHRQTGDQGCNSSTSTPSAFDGDNPLDRALVRDGWVAVQVGGRVAAYRDGSLLNPTILPYAEAFRVSPAADGDAVLMCRGRRVGSPEDCDLRGFVVVDRDGEARRWADLPAWPALGEAANVVVGGNGAWSWSGEKQPLGEGAPIGVLGGTAIVTTLGGSVAVVDTVGRVLSECAVHARIPAVTVAYNDLATRLLAVSPREPGILVVDLDRGPRWIELESAPSWPVWLNDGEILHYRQFAAPETAAILNVESGVVTPDPLPKRGPFPQVAVTGRFDPAQVRAVLLPTRWEQPTPEEREASLAHQRVEIERAAPEELRGFLHSAAPAVRLRACMAPRRVPLGGSRLGGRPDLPVGTRWPTFNRRPLTFFAQLRLDEVASVAPDGALPSSGLLLVFADFVYDGDYIDDDVIHVDLVEASNLKRAAWPKVLAEEVRFRPAVLLPEPFLTFPSEPAGLPDDSYEEWQKLLAAVQPDGPHHRTLGHAASIQGIPPPSTEGTPHVLLLQIDSDGITGMTFGDGGSLQFWVPPRDLAVGDFSRCVVTWDSH